MRMGGMFWVVGVVFGIVFPIVGCASSYQVDSVSSPTVGGVIPRQSRVLVGLAEDGTYGGRVYEGSGEAVARELVRALSSCTGEVDLEKRRAPVGEVLAAARKGGYDFYVQPAILRWEDRATEWSMKRDKLSVRVVIFEVETGRQLDSTVMDGRSRLATLGGDHPADLLPGLFSRYVQRICH